MTALLHHQLGRYRTDFMSSYRRIGAQRQPTPILGALEITSFDGQPANDNGPGGAVRPRRGHRPAGWGLPVAAFVSGLTAALVVSSLSDFLGIG